jgi:hypothetical protein
MFSERDCADPELDEIGDSPEVEYRKQLNLDLTQEAYALLQKLANESGKNMAEVLRLGLALYGIAQEANKTGLSLGIVKNREVIQEIKTS